MTSSPWPTTTCRRSPPFTWWVWCGVVCLCSPEFVFSPALMQRVVDAVVDVFFGVQNRPASLSSTSLSPLL